MITVIIPALDKEQTVSQVMRIARRSPNVYTKFFQLYEKYLSGKIYDTWHEKGNPTYDIVQPVAWDFIP